MTSQKFKIPLFPLNILLLPGEQLPLHIFEPRYQQLFTEAKQGTRFGLPFTSDEFDVHLVAECELLRVTKEYPSGESDVVIECHRILELDEFLSVFPEKLYPGGKVHLNREFNADDRPTEALINVFLEYIDLKFDKKHEQEQVSEYGLMDIAASIGMSNEDKVKFLLQNNPMNREKMLDNVMRYLVLLHRQEKSIENGLILN